MKDYQINLYDEHEKIQEDFNREIVVFKTDKQEYKCKRCGKVFEAIAYKSDNQAACPYCPGIGDRFCENDY